MHTENTADERADAMRDACVPQSRLLVKFLRPAPHSPFSRQKPAVAGTNATQKAVKPHDHIRAQKSRLFLPGKQS